MNKFLICIISNFTATFTCKKIHHINIAPYLDCIVTSEEVGMEKPNPLIFLYALNKINCLKKNAIMIGNDFINDIQGADNLNITAIHITPEEASPQKKGSTWFNNFSQLKKHLELQEKSSLIF